MIEQPRATQRYQATEPDDEVGLTAAIIDYASRYGRYGYRRIRIFLKREGHAMSWQRAHRLWKAAGLQLPQRRPRRRIATSRPRPLPPFAPNSVWAYDFIFDGGTCKENFVRVWGDYTARLDAGVPDLPARVDEDADGSLRDAALAEHVGNLGPEAINRLEVLGVRWAGFQGRPSMSVLPCSLGVRGRFYGTLLVLRLWYPGDTL